MHLMIKRFLLQESCIKCWYKIAIYNLEKNTFYAHEVFGVGKSYDQKTVIIICSLQYYHKFVMFGRHWAHHFAGSQI